MEHTPVSYTKIGAMCEELGIKKGLRDPEHLFTLDCVDAYFFKNDISKENINLGYTDGKDDGGIDFILRDKTELRDELIFCQGKTGKNSAEDDFNAIVKMVDTYKRLRAKNYSNLNSRVKEAYLTASKNFDFLNGQVCFYLFSGQKFTPEHTKKLNMLINEKYGEESFSIDFADLDDIEATKCFTAFQNKGVPEFTFDIMPDSKNRYRACGYPDKNGNEVALAFISGRSLELLFNSFSFSNIVAYNLRGFVKSDKIDKAIRNSIQNNPKDFHCMNNGGSIICEDYFVDEENGKITVKNFSIANAGQTTWNIGKGGIGETNIAISMKFIISTDKERTREIARANNTSKAIKNSDFFSNEEMFETLQYRCAKNTIPGPVEIPIKRGKDLMIVPVVTNTKSPCLTTDKNRVVQLLASAQQYPQKAYGGKEKIFEVEADVIKYIEDGKVDPTKVYELVMIDNAFSDVHKAAVAECKANKTSYKDRFFALESPFHLAASISHLSSLVKKDIKSECKYMFNHNLSEEEFQECFYLLIEVCGEMIERSYRSYSSKGTMNTYYKSGDYSKLQSKLEDLYEQTKDKPTSTASKTKRSISSIPSATVKDLKSALKIFI